MRATSTVLFALLLLACPAHVDAQVTYREIVDRYRTSPNDGVELMLALGDSTRRSGVDEAVFASGAAAWPWEELAAAGMMHTDAGFYFLTRKQPALPQLMDGEKLIARAVSASNRHWDFARRWYRTVESVLKAYGDTTNAQLFAKRFTDLYAARF